MNAAQHRRDVFQSGSKTYFNSSIFFPRSVREDVFVLYGFVRTADNFVDAVPQQAGEFYAFVGSYRNARDGESAGDTIIDAFVDLERRKAFPHAWTESFLKSMEADLTRSQYETVDETLEYVYGSAEVIGLYMARILNLDQAAEHSAKMLGRAMQFINFIRDIDEDDGFGRVYLPLRETSLPNLSRTTAAGAPQEFVRFVRAQLERYQQWQAEAELGYGHLPRRFLAPIRTAADMYNWTARIISADPFVVYRRKVKPSRTRILLRIARNFVAARPVTNRSKR